MKFKNKQCSNIPFIHYTFRDFFSDKELLDIENINILNHSTSLDGERASNNNRFFVDKDNMWSKSTLNRIIDFFLSDDIICMFCVCMCVCMLLHRIILCGNDDDMYACMCIRLC